MLFINNLTIQFGNRDLFREVSGRIDSDDRIGLVGVNGAGKSTLLKIIAGIQETDSDVITKAKGTTVAYLPQEVTAFTEGRTIYEEAESAFGEILAARRELELLHHDLAQLDPAAEKYEALLKRQGELQHFLEEADIFRMRSAIERVLAGLGFRNEDFSRPCREFSGGWLTRLLLAKMLLARPSLLLLDEPTNHLDIESLTWLEGFLASYRGAMVIVSHDRAFLDNITNATWELSLGRLTAYKGNYSRFVAEKELRLEVQRAAYANQQAKIQQTMRFVERFRAKSTKASQVQSRLKQLEKMDRIELEDAEKTIVFRFPPAASCGREVLTVRNLGKSFSGKPVLRGVSFDLRRGDKLAVVGVNGAGKTTLARLIGGQERIDSGEARFGHGVITTYFGQHQAQELAPDRTVLETVYNSGSELTVTQVRSLLGAFLFRGEEVEKKVQVLSGGEKSRVALARIIVTPANLLILDEPTNHLDMASQEVLQEALAKYDGTVVVVSHNRFFLNGFVNKVLEIRDGKATLFEGNLDDYLDKSRAAAEELPEPGRTGAKAEQPPAKPDRKAARQAEALARQERSRRLAPLKKKVVDAEEVIKKLEERKSQLEQELADPELYKNEPEFAGRSREYQKVTDLLRRRYDEWEQAQLAIEKLEAAADF